MNDSITYIVPLNDLAIIEVAGDDALSFLHGQLTNDVASLEAAQAKVGGYCTPKGRLLATLVYWRASQGDTPVVYALVKADIAESLIKRLSMFVLRAKAKISLSQRHVLGLATQSKATHAAAADRPDENKAALSNIDMALLSEQCAAFTIVRNENITFIAAPCTSDAGARWWVIPDDPDTSFVESVPTPKLPTLGAPEPVGSPELTDFTALWHAGDIAAGLPWIQSATADMFIPQTVNLDLINGVNFTKGCYPGQEIVARSHYRGTIKRRMAYGVINETVDEPADSLAGTDIFDAKDPGNPCGRVINAARAPQTHLLLEVQLGDLDAAEYRLGSANGPAITLRGLPYDIRATQG